MGWQSQTQKGFLGDTFLFPLVLMENKNTVLHRCNYSSGKIIYGRLESQ